jgi:magnesium transporter
MILDVLIGSFRSQLLALDDRLGEIQLGMLNGASPKAYDELVQILGIITDGIQELGWYSHDLEEIAETVDRLPGMRPGAQQHFDRHCQRVSRITESGKDICGYFGMNFRVLTAHVQNTLWQFILLGLLLPIASASLSLLLIHRLERHFGILRMGSGQADS